MKASKFTDAEKAFIIKQGEEGTPVAEICRKAGHYIIASTIQPCIIVVLMVTDEGDYTDEGDSHDQRRI